MTSRRLVWWLSILGVVPTLAACGGDDSGGGGAGGAAGSTGGTAGTGAGGSGGGSTDPLVLVPPVALEANVATDCPAAFQAGLGAGQHGGYPAAGQDRSFLLTLPDPTEHSGPRPLMVVFNGTDESGQQIFDRAKMTDFVAAGFLVLAPDGIGNGTVWPEWDAMRQPGDTSENKDLIFFDSLVACVAAHHPVDAKRVYLSGHSAGGIFTNRVLQSRSELVAGGIPASSVFDLTAPEPAVPLDEVAVLVTWGGDNDAWSGSTRTGVTVPEFDFVEQAALASQYYEAQVEQAYCKGKQLGHAWLGAANPWMIDYLLAHPKGLAKGSPWKLEAPAPDASFECSDGAAPSPVASSVSCPSSATAGCQAYCQLIGDCGAENATVEPVLGPQLDALGFSGAGHLSCGGCVTLCETDAASGGTADATVLGCFQTEAASAACGPGITGAMPLIDATNGCCAGATASAVCTRLCGTIQTNDAASGFFTACAPF